MWWRWVFEIGYRWWVFWLWFVLWIWFWLVSVRPCDIQAHLGLGLQPNNMAYTVPKPRPQATFKPIGQMIFISSYHATPPGSHPVNYFLNKEVIARLYYLSVAQQYQGNITTKHIRWGGKQFQCHSSHSHLNTHFEAIELEPPTYLWLRVIITLQLILGYKYEKLRKKWGGGGGRGSREN